MAALRFPQNPRNFLECADWMELKALVSPSRSCSIALVERNLTRLSAYDDHRAIDQIARVEIACSEILGEIGRRRLAAAVAYPFKLRGTDLYLSGSVEDFTCYVFCLCLSWFGWRPRSGRRVFPRRMFEDLSKHAAEAFIGGKAVRFGAPRTEMPKPFKKALLHLCLSIGEGQVKTLRGAVHAQDDKMDLIAWKDFPDRAVGKLFLVGQCSSGKDWEGKLRELDKDAFFDEWFSDRPPSLKQMGIGFFLPHRIHREKWASVTRHAGIVFDRCRIAYWSHKNQNFRNRETYVAWSRSTLGEIRG
ncbi:MAG: hypothetical protein ACRD5R_05825 [Candidatus Acidiferrales bacterium]